MGALDRIGTSPAKSSAKKTPKLAAVVNDAIKAAVDEVIQLKARIKADEAALAEKEVLIIEHVRAQQDEKAFAGQFSKSFEVAGNTGTLLYNTSDKFSVPQAVEAQAAIKALTGTMYEKFFRKFPHLAIKDAILNDDAMMERIFAACESASLDLNAIFEKTEKVVAVDGLDEKQYKLRTASKLAQFRALVRQNKPALK